jgi:hypothetical protein
MILDKYVKIATFGCRKLKEFESLGYDISGEFIDIKVEHLNNGSRQVIKASCDFCGEIVNIIYKEYLRNISIGNKYACSKKCGSEKAKKYNLEKYGVEYSMQLKETQEKVKKTNLQKYGVEYLQQSDIIKFKSKETLVKKYGVDHISKTEIFKKTSKETNLRKLGVEYPTQSKDVKDKIKNTLLEKYGVDNPSKSDQIKSKIKENNLGKYGVEHHMLLDEFKDKVKETNLHKWGTCNPNSLKEIKDKTKETNLQKYGVESPMMLDSIKFKVKETNLKRYGFDNPMKSDKIKETIRLNNLEKWGVTHPMMLESFREKTKETLSKKWGSDSILKSDIFRKNRFLISSDVNYIEYVSDRISKMFCPNCKSEYQIHCDNYIKRKELNANTCTICYPISDQKSIKEKELFEFIKSIYADEVIQSYRDGVEIDIYLPELKIGFEFNGLYWHSEEYKDKNYHLNKTNYFKEKSIRIIHIWEDDWDNKKEIIKSQIRNWLNKSQRIFARKCIVKELKNVVDFLNDNHIQGSDNSIVKLGLFTNDKLISVMTFNKIEGRKKMDIDEYNLSRFCNELNTNVVGGASKLFKHFIKKYKPSRIISYTDKDWSVGNLYYRLGFKNINETRPDYKYIINGLRKNKSNYRKSKIGGNLSESKEMNKKGIFKIWDCGKIKFEILKNK